MAEFLRREIVVRLDSQDVMLLRRLLRANLDDLYTSHGDEVAPTSQTQALINVLDWPR